MLAKFGAVVVVLAVCFIGALEAQTISVPVNGKTVDLVDASELPQTTESTKPDSPSIRGPDQVFSANGEDAGIELGADDGKPVVQLDPPGRRRVLSGGRKMLEDLELSGDGVSAQTTDAGVSANAFGQGELNGLDDSHIRPHGVDATTHVGDKATTAGAAVNPDCVNGAFEGPCVATSGK